MALLINGTHPAAGIPIPKKGYCLVLAASVSLLIYSNITHHNCRRSN